MRKLAITLVVVLLFTCCAFAETQVSGNRLKLTFSGNMANCSIHAEQAGVDIEVTMSIWNGTTKLREWTKSGTGSVTKSGTHSCVSGVTYELQGSYTINGVEYDFTPITKTCP